MVLTTLGLALVVNRAVLTGSAMVIVVAGIIVDAVELRLDGKMLTLDPVSDDPCSEDSVE